MASVRLYLWRLLAAFFPSYRFRNVLFRLLLGNGIGDRSSLHRGLEVYCVGGVRIGRDSTINKYVDLDGRGGVTIGDHVSISPYVRILSASHDPQSVDFAYVVRPVTISDYAWIGTGALILPGVSLGEGSVVAAGSVVTRDVAPYDIVAGNPARRIGERRRELRYSPYWRPPFQ
jgi:maltose O-acetyltransferase